MAGFSSTNPRSYSEIVQVIDDFNFAKDIQNNYKCLHVKNIDQEIDFATVFVKGEIRNRLLIIKILLPDE